ncbi:type VI secretion protein, partial [Burkholderia multivorans]
MTGPAPGRQTGSLGDELTNAAIIALIGAFGVALVLRAAGSVAAFLTGAPQPAAGPASGLGVLFNPTDPATAL